MAPRFRPPGMKEMEPWEYLQHVWDFDKGRSKIPWGGPPKPPSSVSDCYTHIKELGDDYAHWLETKLLHWEQQAELFKKTNPNWRKRLKHPPLFGEVPHVPPHRRRLLHEKVEASAHGCLHSLGALVDC